MFASLVGTPKHHVRIELILNMIAVILQEVLNLHVLVPTTNNFNEIGSDSIDQFGPLDDYMHCDSEKTVRRSLESKSPSWLNQPAPLWDSHL
jgi:hypothetical protein